MLFERARAWTRTLRVRLALWNAIAVFVTSVLVLASVREGIRWTLLREIDQALFEDLDEVDLLLREVQSDGDAILYADLDRKSRGHTQRNWFVQFLNSQGAPSWSSVNATTISGSLLEISLQSPTTRDGFRIIRRTISGFADERTFVIVATSLATFEQDIQRMDRLIGVIGLVAFVVAPLGGFWLAGRATRPLGELIATASRLRMTPLDERLPVQQTGNEIDGLATTINSLLDRLADYLKRRQDFLANAAHDLRTPLAAIRSTTEVALASHRTAEEYRELLSDIIEQSESLELLVNQLLLLSEAESDLAQTHAESVSLSDLVLAATEMFQAVADTHGLRLDVHVESGIVVRGNRQHLRQVANNLIDNAIKYSVAKGEQQPSGAEGPCDITVLLRRDERGTSAIFVVEDHGIGIPPEHLARIFERFYRVNRARSREGTASGTGLGLSICQAIVAAHHGTIHADSLPGRGTRMTVTLPLAVE